ncbi:MAG: Rieske (2Fe-2S) protein [Pseudomonadales bacterium]
MGARTVQPVIGIADLADGEMVARDINGVSVLLCRVDGRYYAVANLCSHAGQRLAHGKLKGYELVCPLHRARFDVRDGRCLAAPATQPIRTFPVTIERGKVHVEVAADRPGPPTVKLRF